MREGLAIRFGHSLEDEKRDLLARLDRADYLSIGQTEEILFKPMRSLEILVEEDQELIVKQYPTFRPTYTINFMTIAYHYPSFRRILSFLDGFSIHNLKCMSPRVVPAIRGDSLRKNYSSFRQQESINSFSTIGLSLQSSVQYGLITEITQLIFSVLLILLTIALAAAFIFFLLRFLSK